MGPRPATAVKRPPRSGGAYTNHSNPQNNPVSETRC
jgi:hypothetical protein